MRVELILQPRGIYAVRAEAEGRLGVTVYSADLDRALEFARNWFAAGEGPVNVVQLLGRRPRFFDAPCDTEPPEAA